MFKDVLKEVVDGTEGGIAALLMGYDGIPVDQYVKDGADGAGVEAVGQEFSVILTSIRNAAEMLQVGATSEVAIRAERLTAVIRYINAEYFVAVTMRPDGNLGKARYLLRTRSRLLKEALE
jgi:predicted regulator of Ras-like GTPase activity (Roadblock/LC7/MglB family)